MQAVKASLDIIAEYKLLVSGPTYSPDILDAAQAQVLQEQDLVMQQALATHRSASERTNSCTGKICGWCHKMQYICLVWSACVQQWTGF